MRLMSNVRQHGEGKVDLLSLRTAVFVASWCVGVVLAVRVLRSQDPLILKVALVLLCAVPVIGPLVVYWVSNFPSRLHPDSQARYRNAVNVYGRWRTEDDEEPKK